MQRWQRSLVSRVGTLLCALALLVTGPAALAQQVLEGRGLVQAKSVADRTVTVDGTVFAVSLTTTLSGADGQPIRLQDLRVSQGVLGVVSVDDVDAVYYRARPGGRGPVLEELRVLKRLPQ